VEFEIQGDRIAAVRELPEDGRPHPWIAPGFIDIQSNGYGGQEFSSPTLTVEHVADITGRQAEFGVTQYLPTVTTASGDTIRHSVRTIAAACRQSPAIAHAIPGIHVEGPYIATEDGPRGAHPLEHCRPPDWDEFQSFQEAAEGRVRLLTLSPEYAAAPEFIRRAVASGVVISIGHTSADSAQIRAAVDAGARLSTHLGNGAHRALRRHPNYLWDQLGDDRLMASLIVDGHHLPREVVQTMVRAKTPARCILVSDLSGLAGLPPGRYATELCELEILPNGRLVIAGQDQLLAGASLPIGVGVANVMAFAGVDLATAVEMATLHPAELLGLTPNRLAMGDAADLTVFEHAAPSPREASALKVVATVSGGVLWQAQGC
jgi:N-acetylglucosamine-6-phosphate deacetylase